MVAARTIGTLVVIVLFFAYLAAANIYVQMTYGNRFGAGSAVPSIQETIRNITNTIAYYAQIAIVIIIAAIAIHMAIKSTRILGVIPFKDVQRHLLLLGPTGAGKTTIAKDVIARAVKKGVKVTILDWKAGAGLTWPRAAGYISSYKVLSSYSDIGKLAACGRAQSTAFAPARRGEYVGFVEGATIVRKINPWDAGGRAPTEKATIAVEMLREITRDIADVSSASATLLLKELAKLYRDRETPTTRDVMDRVEAFLKTAMAERRLAEANMAAALLRRLYWLQIDEERADENVQGSPEVVVYDLSATGSNYLKTLYALSVLTKKYYEAYKRGPSNELAEVVVAEECQNYVRGRRFDDPPSIGERIVNELRAYGVGVVLVCPDPVQIPWHTARDVGALVAIGAQALPDFLEQMRYRYSRRGPTTVGKSNSTFVFHRSKLATVRFKPRPQKPIRLRRVVVEAPTGTRQPRGRYSRVLDGYGPSRADLRHRHRHQQ